MFTAIKNTGDSNRFQQYALELEATVKLTGIFLFTIPTLFYRVLKHTSQSRGQIEFMRSSFDMCAEACDSAKCTAGYYPRVSTVRDNFIKLLDIVSETPALRILKPYVREHVSLWDDLAEDCMISGDDEFRSLINKIAANV